MFSGRNKVTYEGSVSLNGASTTNHSSKVRAMLPGGLS